MESTPSGSRTSTSCFSDTGIDTKSSRATASTWAANTLTDGVTFQASDEILVDLTKGNGHVEIPLEWDWQKSATFEFLIEEPNIQFELIRYHLITDVEDMGILRE